MHWRGIDLGAVAFKALALDGESGRKWYVDSADEIHRYADRHGFDPGVCCDVLAIFSPRCTVEHSIRLAHAFLTTGDSPKAMRARVKAARKYGETGTFGGPKVNAFAAALRGDENAVVVDAWMYRAAREQRVTAKAYREVSAKVVETADALGWPPAETQAAIWQGARAFVGYYDGYAPMNLRGV